MQGEIGRYQETFPSACTCATTMREVLTRLDKLMKQGVRARALRADIADLAPFFSGDDAVDDDPRHFYQDPSDGDCWSRPIAC